MSATVYDWLAAREITDARSRSQELAAQFAAMVGPDAAEFLANQLRLPGCKVTLRRSDWILDSHDHTLISMIIGGVARRVQKTANALNASDVRRWEKLRRQQLRCGDLSLSVQHLDLLSQPIGKPVLILEKPN